MAIPAKRAVSGISRRLPQKRISPSCREKSGKMLIFTRFN